MAALILFAAVLAGCRERPAQKSYADALRCGMTPAQVTQLAHEHGYSGSDRNWLARTLTRRPAKDLQFLDLTFRAGKLVAYREAVYDARTKKTVHKTVELCGAQR